MFKDLSKYEIKGATMGLAMPELGGFLQKALEAEAKTGVNDALEKGLDKLFGRDKKKRRKR